MLSEIPNGHTMSIYSMSMLSQSPMALITFLQCHCECNFWGIFQAYTPAGCPNSNGLINTGRQQKGGVAVSVAVAVKAGIPGGTTGQSYALIMQSQSSPRAKN